ncbi:diguanylate cyclase (GGDEF)-like protein [Paenibacillus cellulosilyticus]|uniref:Diguanylate cyclase (GGDEF)-like protein n=1 Tax=Paenibacillus cellulosilyticus TaxID=375489 RepID=A0A2V2YNW7_9BACL|nr:sensor domain-containing diguanylate cyclase [Paenibacillus cellulosilyticus]PWV95690.1 diguanylate cyclase (GGDEF)-like protein [Paenibacillus cellulosilyticus]QKS47674.1 GGDEF domain-containing protein [Paenibacillus cellulosilyticus]
MLHVITRNKYKLSLPMLLSALTAISVLLTLVVTITASYQSQRETLYDTTLQMNNSSAQKMSLTMSSLFQSMRGSLRTAADYLSDHPSLDDSGIIDHLEYSRKTSSYFNSLFWVDTDGVVKSISPPAIALKGTKLTTAASREALNSHASYLSMPYVSTTGRLIILMSEPIYDSNNHYEGFIGGTIYLQEKNILNTIFGSNPIETNGSYFYVVDPSGKLVFHPDPTRLAEDVSRNAVVQKLMAGKTGESEVVNLKGTTYLAGYATVPTTGWGIVMQSPVQTVYEQLNNQIRSTIIYMALPFLVIMLVAMYIARKLALPFAALTDYIGQAAGAQETPPPVSPNHWNREAHVLSQTVVLAVETLRKQSEELSHAALIDPLTGLMNRRAMEGVLSKWTATNVPFGLIVMDLDRFKCINDTLGHQVGDEVLKCLANVVQRSVRSSDICCRFGGEEFVVLLPHISADEAFRLAERIRKTMEKEPTPANRVITLSLGIAVSPQHGTDSSTLFRLADEALYAAKEAGRNRTMLAALRDQ